MRNIVFFDVCGTLYNSNTTYDFYEFLFRNHKKRRLLYACFKSKLAKAVWKTLALVGLSKIPRAVSLSFLANLDDNYVKQEAVAFVHKCLEPQKNLALHHKLMDAKRNGKTVVLVSASIHPIVEAIATKLGNVDFLCTSLGVANGKYTGSVDEDLEGIKLDKVEQKYGIKDNVTWFYTDNKEDLPLLMKVNHPNVVIRKQKDKLFWRKNLKRTDTQHYEFLA
ncbi:HAD-IB family phosphatase [Pontibacter korlensis]|uniref:Haloacid dehalogenase n=1 Tax=Pontibacter korlensis TaxID=400092 RepID=A0A0E3ZCY9_9BACT|nr:HAD-IB family phosphatase [Pontibacter korlensis]AKD01949.1 hypothetical protein PKOR_00815 [Pontibacter korlensis]